MDIEPALWVSAANDGLVHIFTPPLQEACDKYGINTEQRVAAFIAQLAHESMGFSKMEENMHYTTAARIHTVYKKYFPTEESARGYVGNAKKLANRVYAGRYGNRIGTDDGWNYRGRGIIHLTFRDNYRDAGHGTNLPLIDKPDLAKPPHGAAQIAGWYWDSRRINEAADVDTADAFCEVTKRINGGYNGLQDRFDRWNKIRHIFGLPERHMKGKTT